MEWLSRLGEERVRIRLGLYLCLAVAVLLHATQSGKTLDRSVLDDQFGFLQNRSGQQLPNDVVIVGIDDASRKAFKEPFAFWHPHLGRFLEAMAVARPSVLGLDIVLPERSYEFMIPGYDRSLAEGLHKANAQMPLVLAQTVEVDGTFRTVHESFVAASGGDTLGSVLLCQDDDGIVRRFDPNLCTVNALGTTFVDKMAMHLGSGRSGSGLVNFGTGARFDYIPFTQVLEWYARSDEARLQQVFGGRPVMLGDVSGLAERVRSPVPLAAWSPSRYRLPGVLMHAQILRSMLGGGLIRDVSPYIVLALTLCASLFWLGRGGWMKSIALLAFPALLLAISTWLMGQGYYLPPGEILYAGLFAFLARTGYDAVRFVQQRNWLRATFGSYVSQEVLHEIMAGNIRSGQDGARLRLCILFADIHGFGARSESRPAPEVVALLNDYFSEMTVAIHKHKGTVDKFIGDGIMAFFGAPQALECPEKNALEAAQEMLLRVRHVNERLQGKGIAPVEIGIALHVGEVVIGRVGSESRQEYTAIGDAVSLTAKLEDLTKVLHYPVVCTAAVAGAVENAGGLVDCGEQDFKGTALRVYGWNPPLLAEN